jgi:hypothetical protein
MLVVAMIAVAVLLVAAAAKCLLYGGDRFPAFARTSAKSKYSQISKSTREVQESLP